MEEQPIEFHKLIKKLRIYFKTQDALAQKLKVTRLTISNWESQRSRPTNRSIRQVNRLAKDAGMEVK